MKKPSQWIAGIARGHNAGVCLLKDGKVVFSIEEERLSRHKYDGGPYASMMKILDYTDKLDYLVVAHTQNLDATAGKVDLAALEIDGATDISADLTTSDLIIVDDGAGGTNRKAALSRLITLVDANAGFATKGFATAMAIAL